MITNDNHVKFVRLVWVTEGGEAKWRSGLQVNICCGDISFVQYIIKQLLHSVFDNQGLDESYQTKPKMDLTLVILYIPKTSSNNCLE